MEANTRGLTREKKPMAKSQLVFHITGWVGDTMIYSMAKNVSKLNRKSSGLLNFDSQQKATL